MDGSVPIIVSDSIAFLSGRTSEEGKTNKHEYKKQTNMNIKNKQT